MVDYRIDLTDQRETMAFVQFALTKKGRFKKSLTFFYFSSQFCFPETDCGECCDLSCLHKLVTPSGTPTSAKLLYLHFGEKNKEQILVWQPPLFATLMLVELNKELLELSLNCILTFFFLLLFVLRVEILVAPAYVQCV